MLSQIIYEISKYITLNLSFCSHQHNSSTATKEYRTVLCAQITPGRRGFHKSSSTYPIQLSNHSIFKKYSIILVP